MAQYVYEAYRTDEPPRLSAAHLAGAATVLVNGPLQIHLILHLHFTYTILPEARDGANINNFINNQHFSTTSIEDG